MIDDVKPIPVERIKNVELKKRWIEALRSGKYLQGKGKLRENQSQFCCLGVLCDVVDDTKWYLKAKNPIMSSSNNEYVFHYDSYLSVLPHDIEGLLMDFDFNRVFCCTITDFLPREGEPLSLIAMNDSGEFSFTQIADIIEYFY